MIGRMSSNQIHQSSLDVILDAQARLQRTQEELASGKRIQTPADDPVASAQILKSRSELARIESYQRNTDYALNEISLAESTVGSAEDAIIRIKNLTLQAANATYSDSDRQAMATEISGLKDHLLALANTKSASGEYIFAGANVSSAPYTVANGVSSFTGDTNIRAVNLSSSVTIATRLSGQEVFGDATAGSVDIFNVIETTIGALQTNDTALISTSIDELDLAANQLFDARSALGVRMNRVEDQRSLNEDFSLSLSKGISSLEDLDYAKAISELSMRMLALESAQKAYTKTQGLSLFNYL